MRPLVFTSLSSHGPKQRGFSLIELLLVLGVLAILLVAAFVVYPQVRKQQLVNEQVTNTRLIMEGIRAVYGNRPYTTLDQNFLLAAKLVPAKMIVDGRIQNHWGGNFLVAGWGETPGAMGTGVRYSRMRLIQLGIPQEYCVPMAMGLAGMSERLYVAPFGSTVWEESNLAGINGDVNPSEVTLMCNRTSSNGTYTIAIFAL